MAAGSLIGLAAGCTLICGGIKKSTETERQKIAAEIAYTCSYAFLTFAWIALFREAEGNTGKQIFSMVMTGLCVFITLISAFLSIAYVIDYHQHKEIKEAEYSIKQLQKMYNECEKFFPSMLV